MSDSDEKSIDLGDIPVKDPNSRSEELTDEEAGLIAGGGFFRSGSGSGKPRMYIPAPPAPPVPVPYPNGM